MIGLYPFMNYPGVVLTHSELPGNQWSFLSPEGIFERQHTLARWNEFIAGWKDLPGGGCGYEAMSGHGRGILGYGIALSPSDDSVRLELQITNHSNELWRDLFVDMCLMHIRAPEFYDPQYKRTFIDIPGGKRRVSELAEREQRPLFIRHERSNESMHFYAPPKNRFWNWSDTRTTGNVVTTRSIDGQRSVSFEWEEIQMIACNWDLEHGCVHADPYLGNIPPGESRRISGMITFGR